MEAKIVEKEKIIVDIRVSKARSRWLQVEYFANLINQMLIGYVTIHLSWMCIRVKLIGSSLHCWLCTIGFSLLMAEGVMTHYDGNTALFSYRRKTKTTIHWVLQALGGAIGIAGGIYEMCQLPEHFTTLHGRIGFSALILCAISMITGLCSLYAKHFRKICSPLPNKFVHNFLGIVTLVMALIAQFYGYQMPEFRSNVTLDFMYMIEVITLLSLVLSCFGPLSSLLYKFLGLTS